MEYLKKSSPARPRATAPTTAAPRIPIQRSQSIGADGGPGGAGGENDGGGPPGTRRSAGDAGRAVACCGGAATCAVPAGGCVAGGRVTSGGGTAHVKAPGDTPGRLLAVPVADRLSVGMRCGSAASRALNA